MKQAMRRGLWWGGLLSLVVAVAWAQTPRPPAATKGKLERLRIAVAPLGYDTNFSWLQTLSGQLDKRPALEYLVGVDRHTGAYIPELAEQWEMAPDGKSWTITLRKGVTFHEHWGAFTARDVRHAVFLIAQPEAIASYTPFWRNAMGITKNDTVEEVTKKVEQGVEIVDDYKVVFHLKQVVPEFLDQISAIFDLPMESKARWDAGGKDLYAQKVVGTGPFAFVERKVGSHVLYKRVENHWRQTPEYKELEFRWVPEGVTRLASLMAGEVHISDVDRALHKDAMAKGMKLSTSQMPAMQFQWQFGGTYFATPDKLDHKNPFLLREVRQAMNMAVNRQAIAQTLLGGKTQPHRVMGFHPHLSTAIWPGIWNPDWDTRFEERFGYDPVKAKALLKQAGYPQGFEFTLYLYTLPGLPEINDVGQAMALDFQAIGLQPKLVETEFPRVRELFRSQTIHGGMFPTRHATQALDTARNVHKAKDSAGHWYEHPLIEERLAALTTVVDKAERTRLLREIGDHKVQEFAEIPLFWLYADATVNPKYIAEYTFPGTITGYFTHLEYVKLAP